MSSFELYARLPRQRECAKDGLARSSKFGPVVEAVKGIALDCDSPCSFGGKNFESNHCPFRKHIHIDKGNFDFDRINLLCALLGSTYPRTQVILPSH